MNQQNCYNSIIDRLSVLCLRVLSNNITAPKADKIRTVKAYTAISLSVIMQFSGANISLWMMREQQEEIQNETLIWAFG